MKFWSKIKNNLPSRQSALLAVVSAILLILAFPDFELWFLAWIGLIPLFYAIEREKESFIKSFLTGWLFGLVFFFVTCWWLTFAPITYAKVPPIIAYFLLFCACSVVGFYPALFSGIFSFFLKRFGHWGILSAPFVWTATEFLRLWTSGNNWNALGYSQAFDSVFEIKGLANIGGVFLISFIIMAFNAYCFWCRRFGHVLKLSDADNKLFMGQDATPLQKFLILINFALPLIVFLSLPFWAAKNLNSRPFETSSPSNVIAVQPNVPMSGLNREKWASLRKRQTDSAEKALQELKNKGTDTENQTPTTVILPESPMNFQYELDPLFRAFVNNFARKNNVSVLFNSAEPDRRRQYGYFNSAVLISEKGEKVVQYDKIHLLPFGEFVPLPQPIEWIVPTMVGRFSHGEEYDLLPFGDAKAGVMICFESHFPSLSREYARNGADVLVEMTNDGYLGNTAVLRQHLASAVFRAVETNRPVLRVTNVGVTAYINEKGDILDEAPVYKEATRIWSVSKSDGKQTFYVKYGEWFAILCSIVSLGLVGFCLWAKRSDS
jgi:apolipoprotein N-acyltransferase